MKRATIICDNVTICYNEIGDYMKHCDKKKVLYLLKNKYKLNNTYSYISNITGYHEKYLIKLKKNIDMGIDIEIHKSQGKRPHNYIDQTIKNNIINSYNENTYKSKREFYDSIKNKINVSYPFVADLLKKNHNDKQILILKYFKINSLKYCIAFDYNSKNILYTIKSNKSNLINWILLLEYVFNTYGVPKYLYDNGFFTHNKSFSNDICNKLKIKRIDKLKTGNIKKKIFEYRKPSIKYRKLLIPVTTLYLKKEAKTIKENIIQFKNNRYLIMSNTNIKKRQKIIIHYTWDYTNIIVEYNNKFYNTQILAKVTSVKGKSKYY